MHLAIAWELYTIGAVCVVSVLCVSMAWRHWARIRTLRVHVRAASPHDGQPRLLDALLAICERGHAPHTTLYDILTLIARSFDVSEASLLLKTAEGEFQLHESCGADPSSFRVERIAPFVTWIAEHQRVVTRRELVHGREFSEVKPMGLHYCVQFHAEAVVPFLYKGRLVGVMNLGPRAEDLPFDVTVCDALRGIARVTALIIKNVELREAWSQSEIDAQQMERLRANLLANVSHELRTPLASIIGLTEHLLEEGAGLAPRDQRRQIQMVHESGRRLLHTVTALVDLAKLESGGQALEIGRINMARLFADVTPMLHPSQHTKIALSVADDLPPIYGDRPWVLCLFQHLLENAVKFTEQGTVWVDAERAGDMLKIGIHDTGIGIRPEQQQAIFSGFVQGASGVDRSHEGTGVGLAISRRVVELHGGRIWLQSRPGVGSHFFVTLPLKPS
jgi:signal transduction histidine kinase